MEKNPIQEDGYIDSMRKGFNDGYILADYCPELLKNILKNTNCKHQCYFNGLKRGMEQFQEEQIEKRIEKWRQERINKGNSSFER